MIRIIRLLYMMTLMCKVVFLVVMTIAAISHTLLLTIALIIHHRGD